MDPKACLELAFVAFQRGSFKEASEHLANYRQWRGCGGFEPTGVTTARIAMRGDECADFLGYWLELTPMQEAAEDAEDAEYEALKSEH